MPSGAGQSAAVEETTYRLVAQVNTFPLRQRFGEVAVVEAGIFLTGQDDHRGGGGGFGYGIVRPSAPVPVGQGGGTVSAVSGEETFGMALTYSHYLRSLGDGKLAFQNTVEYLDPGLFLLVQCQIPHEMTFSLTS